jgi:hypothetical protein
MQALGLGRCSPWAHADQRGPLGALPAADRQVPVGPFFVAPGTRAQPKTVVQALAHALLLVDGGFAEPTLMGGRGLGGRVGGPHQQHHVARRAAPQDLAQLRLPAQRILGLAQRVAEAPQLVGTARVLLRFVGQAPQTRHQRRDDPAHRDHGHEQQAVVVQIDRERAAGRHEGEVEGQHAQAYRRRRERRPPPDRGHRGGQDEHQRQIGEVDLAIERQHERPGDDPGQQPRPPGCVGVSCRLAVRSPHRGQQ